MIPVQGVNTLQINNQTSNQINNQTQKEISQAPLATVKERIQTELGYVPTIQEKTILDAIEKANKKLEGADKEFEFSVHEKTKQIMVKVLDKETKEIVREIPSEKILDMVAAMCENAGLFIDEKL